MPATSGGATLAAWLERVTAGVPKGYSGNAALSVVEKSGSWHPCQDLRGQGQLFRGVHHILERGPVSLWW